ncbi:glycoside hydrolase family 88 protein [Flavobacteriaceae bacterium F89]|uniref:Glycoside hydrolase family 88 protein n=1 Tax=Cerina litoralis TaxID=2874477 RepID=A0AAE3EY21_9FLAO|nr:hypothetical protein [Cerina litoralis]MCG2462378.1 glycoside hydrolase family 88 protein [Cerina litoralis]
MKIFINYLFLSISLLFVSCADNGKEPSILDSIPPDISKFINNIKIESLGTYKPIISVDKVSGTIATVHLKYEIKDTLRQNDWHVEITPNFKPDFHWAPHLTPTDEHIIAQHVFRAPTLIVSGEGKQLVVMPDLDLLEKGTPVKWYMDMDAPRNKLTLGLSDYRVEEHVLFKRKDGATYLPQKLEFSFTIMVSDKPEEIKNPWRKPLAYFWRNWGAPLYESVKPLNTDLELFVKHTYDWAFNSWKDAVWQEFELNGKKVGAPVFIVNITQSPNYPGEVNEREFRSIWNQAWFSSLRSASGLYRYARSTKNTELMEKARMGKELALSFPQKKGFFKGLIATEMEEVIIDGEKYKRSKGWKTHYFGNSNRNPYTGDPKMAPYHILDMSWTAYLMLTWYDELEKDERLLKYATDYADALLSTQDMEGFFPGWLSLDSLEPMQHLNRSPETSMSVTFLLKFFELTKDKKYLDPALKAMKAVMNNIVPKGRWEDFETYWSCSRYGSDNLVNKKVERNDMYKQNNFSMYWTAEALFNCYKITGDKKYIENGQRTLDEMLMTQAIWQPPYMYVSTLGGFGVMNADGEWNDSRQSLFSELILKYGKELDNEEYVQRGIAALKASFVMMYCSENLKTKEQWERKWNFFGKEEYGFMMENYGHDGTTSETGIGIGEFTIYDWGNGAASEAYNRILDHFGEDLMLKN